jgi:hypothetical protein
MGAVANIATGSASYIWEDPGDSIMIQVNLDLVERLGAAVQRGIGSGQRGNEIGGILLGRPLPGFRRAVVIEDFELTPCEHLRGASYTLSPKDRRQLGGRLARRGPRQVVGFFRSHTRPGMYLDQDDFAVFGHYFPDSWQVCLLVRPADEGPAMGGFFFWEDGDVNRTTTYRKFPFDAGRLVAGNYPITGEQPGGAVAPHPVPVLVPAHTPAPVPVLAPRADVQAPRKLPSLPWVVVPVIAVLFLIAGLFVSEKQAPVREVATSKSATPVEPLLPEPAPRAAKPTQTAVPPAAEGVADGNAPTPAVEPKPVAAPKAKLAKKPSPLPALLPPTAARVPAGEFEPPPQLAVPAEKLEPRLGPVLHSHANSAPPPEVDATYEGPHAGVFKRALHKIEGVDGDASAIVPPSPIRKVTRAVSADARPVDVKVFINAAGNVTRVQLLTKGGDVAGTALAAARQWQFTPARKHDKPVASEMVLHFR